MSEPRSCMRQLMIATSPRGPFPAQERAWIGTIVDGFDYGAHGWLWPDFAGSFGCHGYEGQYTVVVPDRELVVVHLGKSPIERRPILTDRLRDIFRAAT